jgi:hypothetical protein
MNEIPRNEASDWETEEVPIGYVQSGLTVVINQGQGPRAFLVEKTVFNSRRQDDGGYFNTHTLVLTPIPAAVGERFEIKCQAGTNVVVVYGKGRRPIALPPRPRRV